MKRKQLVAAAAALFGMTTAPVAMADVTFNGFGQVIYGQTLDDHGVGDLGYEDAGDFAPESLLALQATAPVSDKLDAVAQIVARGKESYEPEFAWAYARYQIDADWSVKAGRQRLPFYRYSDYLEVGAAYPFLRTPMSVYSIPFSNYDGVSVGRGFSLGNWELNAQFLYGTFKESVETGGQEIHIDLQQQVGTVLEGSYNDWLSLRLSGFKSKLSLSTASLDALVGGLVATGNTQAAADIATDEEDAYFVGLGAGITRGALQLDAEYTQSEVSDSYIGKSTGWYVSAAYRVGAFTPVVSYGVAEAESEVAPLSPNTPPELIGGVAGVLASRNTEAAYTSVGLRYDLTASAALKLDYTHYDPKHDGADGAEVVAAGLVFSF